MAIETKKFAFADQRRIAGLPDGANASVDTSTGEIIPKVDDVTIERNASQELQVKDGGITEAKRISQTVQTITSSGFTIQHNNSRVVLLQSTDNYTSDTTTAIANGSVTGQRLIIFYENTYGSSGKTIIIKNNANTDLGGDIKLYHKYTFSGQKPWVELVWDGDSWVLVDIYREVSVTVSGLVASADGFLTSATNNYSHAEGYGGSASGSTSHVEGFSPVASGSYSHAQGRESTADGTASHAQGRNSYARFYGASANASGMFSSTGDAQFVQIVSYGTTTDATQTEIFPQNSSDYRITVPTNHAYAFSILIAAKRTETSMECAGYELKGVIKNDNGTTSIVGSVTQTVLAEDDASWDVTAEADDTNEALSIKVTGADGKTIHWVATVNLTEVG